MIFQYYYISLVPREPEVPRLGTRGLEVSLGGLHTQSYITFCSGDQSLMLLWSTLGFSPFQVFKFLCVLPRDLYCIKASA
jgi:hypothetical protein